VDFDGSAAITVTAAAGTLTGTTLNATVVTSSLTAVGTLASGAVPASLVTAGSFGAGDYTVTGKLTFAGTPTLADGTIGLTAVYGLTLRAIEGSSYDFAVLSKSNGSLIFGIEGTVVTIPGDTTITGGRLYVQGTSFASIIDRALQVGNGALTSAVARLTVAGSTTAATGSATHLKVEGTLIAAAHNDVLRGAYIVPAYTPGAYTGLTFCGLEIGNVAGGATNYAFKTGTGAVYLGDALTVVGAASFNGAVTIGDASGDALTFHPAAWTLTNAVTITGTWANLGAVTTVDINGGTIDGVTIGGATPAAATCTDVTLTGMGKAARQTDESVGGTDTITFTTNWFAITLTSNWTTATIAGMVAGSSYILQVIQDATGSRTIAWPATFKWTAGAAPTLSTAANAIDVLSIAYDGTNHYAALAVKGAA